jgi:RES domain
MALFTHPSVDIFEEVAMLLDVKRADFEIPVTQHASDEKHFPRFLEKRLAQFATYYQSTLKGLIDDHPDSRADTSGVRNFHGRMLKFNNFLVEAVNHYYAGNLIQANKSFGFAIKMVGFAANTVVATLPATTRFYRARVSNGTHFQRTDLFHTPFEKRHLVATSRYSIPGLPALYLGSSVYVCWEEFNRIPLRDLYISQFRSYRDLRVIKIQRMEDLLATLRATTPDAVHSTTTLLLRYLLLLPLSIACSIKTRELEGSFKPEYIIPQLLLQHITTTKDVDGIMFPSTKVDYNGIYQVPAYNYVFPVKHSNSSGFCRQLAQDFVLTQPTSIEIESLLNYGGISSLPLDRFNAVSGEISLVQGAIMPYQNTAFGRLEEVLHTRPSDSILDF